MNLSIQFLIINQLIKEESLSFLFCPSSLLLKINIHLDNASVFIAGREIQFVELLFRIFRVGPFGSVNISTGFIGVHFEAVVI